MAKESVDKQLSDLYNRAKKETVECPNCKHRVEVGGDFGMLKAAMELILKYESIKRKGDGSGDDGAGLADE